MPTADERWNDETLAALAHDEPFLRQLALRLVGDPATADDLVQETWLKAFSLRPALEGGLYGWSSKVLRRLAARQRRGEDRRAAREAAAARPEHQDDPLDAVQRRLDAQAALVSALRNLSPEQREALVLRYAEERSFADIAARQRTSIVNVKARLARGMAALRADLDHRAGGERGAHGIVLAPLLAPALRRGKWLTTGAPTLTLAGGTLLMGNTLKLSFVAVVLVAIALIARQLGGEPPRPPETTPAVVAAADADLSVGDAPVTLEGSLEAPVRAAGVAAATDDAAAPVADVERELVVRVTGPGRRSAKVTVHAQPPVGSMVHQQQRAQLQVVVGTEARCVLAPLVAPLRDGTAVGALVFQVEAEGCASTRLELALGASPDDTNLEVELALRETATITGSVRTRSRHMLVQAYALGAGDQLGEPLGSTNGDGEGRFALQVDHAGEVALAVLSNDHQPATARCLVTRGQEAHVGPLDRAPAVAIQGAVMAGESPTARARIVAVRVDVAAEIAPINTPWIEGVDGAPNQLAWDDGAFVLKQCEAKSGEDGSFVLGGLTPGAYSVSAPGPAAARASWGETAEPLRVLAPAEGVRLDSGWAELQLEFDVPATLEGSGVLRFGDPGSAPQGSVLWAQDLVDGRGHTIAFPPRATKEVHVEFPGYNPVVHMVRAERAGEVVRKHVRLERSASAARLTLALTGVAIADGEPFLLIEPRVTSPGDPSAALLPEGFPRRGVARDGRVTFEDVPTTKRTLRLVPGGAKSERRGDLADVLFDFERPRDGEHTVTLRLQHGAPLRARALAPDGTPIAARARVRDASGAQVPALFVCRTPEGSTSTSTWGVDQNLGGAGWNVIVPNLAPGEYVMEVEVEGHGRRDVPFRLTAAVQNEVTAQF